MAEKLVKYFELAAEKGGLQAKMRMAMKTGIPSSKAESEPDSPEVLAKFYEAAKEIIGPDAPKL